MKQRKLSKNCFKRFACVLLSVLLLLLNVGCSKSFSNADVIKSIGSYKISDSGKSDITFEFDSENSSFTVSDSRNSKIWSSGLTEEYYNKPIQNKMHRRNMMSLFSVTYMDSENTVEVCKNTDSGMNVSYSCDGDTVTAEAEIIGTDIYFTVIFQKVGNSLTVSLPMSKIYEEGDYRLITFEALPFFGASIPEEDGYIFYPDGCGTIYEFKNHQEGASTVAYKKQIYSDNFVEYEDYLTDVKTGVKSICIPVFGVKQGNGAFMANIVSGQADTAITLYPFGNIYDAARISPTFNYRYLYEMDTMSGDKTLTVAEKNHATEDFEVCYSFLANEQASYSGMAGEYRSFLLNNNLLNNSKYTFSSSIDYLMSLKEPILFWERNVAASTFENAIDTLKDISENTNNKISFNLLGWQSDGYNIYPSHFPVSSACGGKSGLKNLLNFALKNKSTVVLNDNFFSAQESRSGYSKRNDLASNLKGEIYADQDKTDYLLDVRASFTEFTDDWVKKAKKQNISGVNLDDVCRILYSNNAKENPLRRNEAKNVLCNLMKTAKEQFSFVGINGGNSFGFAYADMLYGIPETSSKDFLFDRDVPFVQMVLHGFIPYTSEIPGNFSNNFSQTVLKWAEYGFVPYFSVSNSSAVEMKDCYNEGVVISKYSSVQKTVLDTINQFDINFSALNDVPIKSHDLLTSRLVAVTYENGAKVLVNNTNTEIKYEDVVIKSNSFAVVDINN